MVFLDFQCRVAFEFQHNVMGRSIYAQGTVDAVLFLAKKVSFTANPQARLNVSEEFLLGTVHAELTTCALSPCECRRSRDNQPL